MPDVFTKVKRSEVMSKIRGKGNKATELALAKLFREHSITGWRRHYPITGKPDFAFPKCKLPQDQVRGIVETHNQPELWDNEEEQMDGSADRRDAARA